MRAVGALSMLAWGGMVVWNARALVPGRWTSSSAILLVIAMITATVEEALRWRDDLAGRRRARAVCAKTRIVSPPGRRLRSIAAFCCSRRTMEARFDPLFRELFDDYSEAIAAGDTKEARRVQIFYTIEFWKVFTEPAVNVMTWLIDRFRK
jgi:hypothetical protein